MKNIYNKELDDFTRLTRHYQDWEVEMAKPNKDYITTDYFCPRRDISYDDCLNKLGQLEDIEEELGIDLTILFKALEECYVEGHKGTAIIINHEEIGIKYQINDYSWTSKICKIKDYGKTWALTKEELL